MNIEELLSRGVVDVIGEDALRKKLEEGAKLRIKLGIDPTGSELHLGHSVVLRKLRQFQDLGHTVILLIGDYTARIGDPTGKSETRVVLTGDDVERNMKSYVEQASVILDADKLEVRYNSEWFDKMGMGDVLNLASFKTVNQMLQREDFKNRYSSGQDISLTEFLYPLMQGYDSVELNCDVEIGGTDQLFNMLVGRDMQKVYGVKKRQAVVTVPLLEGLSGGKKMSKSLGNYIGLRESASEIYGKTMSIVDELIIPYFELLTSVSGDDIAAMSDELKGGANPRDLKMRLAREIVGLYWNDDAAIKAEEEFVNVFKNKSLPDEIEVVVVETRGCNIVDLICSLSLAASKSEARRLVSGGAVKISGEKVEDVDFVPEIGDEEVLLQVGKRHFRKLRSNG
ncbi:tyrosine--tRNA ligase [Candidatus Peregrinibacteria bacterium HGW-Peregrinibacteria-1]|jgi:tyrosyl-tRNA synthetase|nr:MAG: tyrosine--tRNA ligase [Candidatus Peregrinibacteria bacterium HGW-Peregrinibacteria-1]